MKIKLIGMTLFVFFALLFITCSDDTENTETKLDQLEGRSIGEFTDDFTFKVFPKSPYNNIENAEFRLWVPENSSDLRATLVLLAGASGSALGLTELEEWRTYTEQEKLALCGVFLTSNCVPSYTYAIGGSGQALMDAVTQIAEKNNMPEIASLPFLLRGYSAGGVFAHNFSSYQSDRTVAFSDIRGIGIGKSSSRNIEVPGLILSGELEGEDRSQYLRDIVLDKRTDNGLWSFAQEPKAEHFSDLKPSDSLIRTFFFGVLKQRIPDDAGPLKSIKRESGWLGNITGSETYPYSDYPGNASRANWLVDETFAKAWVEFQ